MYALSDRNDFHSLGYFFELKLRLVKYDAFRSDLLSKITATINTKASYIPKVNQIMSAPKISVSIRITPELIIMLRRKLMITACAER